MIARLRLLIRRKLWRHRQAVVDRRYYEALAELRRRQRERLEHELLNPDRTQYVHAPQHRHWRLDR